MSSDRGKDYYQKLFLPLATHNKPQQQHALSTLVSQFEHDTLTEEIQAQQKLTKIQLAAGAGDFGPQFSSDVYELLKFPRKKDNTEEIFTELKRLLQAHTAAVVDIVSPLLSMYFSPVEKNIQMVQSGGQVNLEISDYYRSTSAEQLYNVEPNQVITEEAVKNAQDRVQGLFQEAFDAFDMQMRTSIRLHTATHALMQNYTRNASMPNVNMNAIYGTFTDRIMYLITQMTMCKLFLSEPTRVFETFIDLENTYSMTTSQLLLWTIEERIYWAYHFPVSDFIKRNVDWILNREPSGDYHHPLDILAGQRDIQQQAFVTAELKTQLTCYFKLLAFILRITPITEIDKQELVERINKLLQKVKKHFPLILDIAKSTENNPTPQWIYIAGNITDAPDETVNSMYTNWLEIVKLAISPGNENQVNARVEWFNDEQNGFQFNYFT